MPFSFNPDQSGTSVAPGAGSAPSVQSAPIDPTALPSVPNSPFLFIQQRGKDLTVSAYLQLVLILVAILAVIGAIVIAIYSFYLNSSIASKKADLEAKQASFKEYPFTDMKRLSDRTKALDGILKTYVSIRSPLKLLEDVVEKQVVFTELTVSKDKSGQYTADMVALTRDYPSLIQQLEALKLAQYTKIVPNTKIDKFTQEKNLDLRVRVSAPLQAQGQLPEDIVFITGSSGAASSQTPTPQTASTTTPAPVVVAPPVGGTTPR